MIEGFGQIIGYEDIKAKFRRYLDEFKNPEKYRAMNAQMTAAVLLDGAPGCGKSTICRAFIEESGVNAFEVSKKCTEQELIEIIKTTFVEAKNSAPSIVFLDDMDKFADIPNNEYNRDAEVYVVIQSCLDDVKDSNVFVLATSNRARSLPSSLIRAGRFSVIGVPRPKNEDIKAILEYYLADKQVEANVNVDDLAKLLGGSAVADLQDILREAAVEAVYKGADVITMNQIVEIALSREHQCANDLDVDDEELRETAYHEASHLVVAEVLNGPSVGYTAILPRGNGKCDGVVSRYKRIYRRPFEILCALAGKVGTELYFPHCASGCSADIDKANMSIRMGLMENATLGFDLIGPEDGGFAPSQSLMTKQETVTAAELVRYSHLCREILLMNRKLLEDIAESLIERRILLHSDIQRIISKYEITTINVS